MALLTTRRAFTILACLNFANLNIVFSADDLKCDVIDDRTSLLQHASTLTHRSSPVRKQKHFSGANGLLQCLDATSFFNTLSQQTPWKTYSQGNQDSIIASLFNSSNLGVTNKYFIEFGYCTSAACPPNTKLLQEQGWIGLELDGNEDDPSINLHKEFITPENIAALFAKYGAEQNPDYVSIDIDSCDLWVFLAMAQNYQPRVVSVEYNSKYSFEESRTNACKDKAGQRYTWTGDDMYGVSLLALHKAAEKMGYTMVAAEPKLDVFLVRKDLVCPGTEVQLESFRAVAGLDMGYRPGTPDEVARWIVDYSP